MYEVQWGHQAVGDLRTKVVTQPVRHYLMEVATSSLDRHFPDWGGRTAGLLWRRGVTAVDESLVERLARRGIDRDDGEERAHDFVLVYRASWSRRRTFNVVGVLTNDELIGGYFRRHY